MNEKKDRTTAVVSALKGGAAKSSPDSGKALITGFDRSVTAVRKPFGSNYFLTFVWKHEA